MLGASCADRLRRQPDQASRPTTATSTSPTGFQGRPDQPAEQRAHRRRRALARDLQPNTARRQRQRQLHRRTGPATGRREAADGGSPVARGHTSAGRPGQRRLDARPADRPQRHGRRLGDRLDRPPGRRAGTASPIQPGTRARVDLTNVPANYDVALFTDIAQAFNDADDLDDLQQLSAEFAGDAFAPSVFSPSVFSPSCSRRRCSRPSVFRPRCSARRCSRRRCSRPRCSRRRCSSRRCSRRRCSRRRCSARRSSATARRTRAPRCAASRRVGERGHRGEHLDVATWNNTGEFYVRVAGRNGAYSPMRAVRPRRPRRRKPVRRGRAERRGAGLRPRPKALADGDPRRLRAHERRPRRRCRPASTKLGDGDVTATSSTSAQAALAWPCSTSRPTTRRLPYAKNLVAEAIRDIVLAYRGVNPGLASSSSSATTRSSRSSAIRMLRPRPESGLRAAGRRQQRVAGQPAPELQPVAGRLRRDDGAQLKGVTMPVPDLPVGRLVETPAEITGMIDAFLADGVLDPTRSLVTGYDFLADAADAVQRAERRPRRRRRLADHQPGRPADQDGDPPAARGPLTACATRAVGSDHDIIYLAGHFSANNLLAADYSTTMNATEVAASSLDLSNALVVSAGCHSGYTIVDGDGVPNVTQSLDWMQAFAQQAGDGRRRHRLPVRRHRLPRVQRAAVPGLRRGAAPGGTGRWRRRRARRGQAAVPRRDARRSAGSTRRRCSRRRSTACRCRPSTCRPAAPGPPSDRRSSAARSVTRARDVLGLSRRPHPPPALAGLQTRRSSTARHPPSPPAGTAGRTASSPTRRARAAAATSSTSASPTRCCAASASVGARTPTRRHHAADRRAGDRAEHAPLAVRLRAFFPSRLWSVNYFDGLQDGDSATRLMLTPAQYRTEAPALSRTSSELRDAGLRLFYSGYTAVVGGNRRPSRRRRRSLASRPTSHRPTVAVQRPRGRRAGRRHPGGLGHLHRCAPPGQWTSLDLVQDLVDSTLWTGTLTGRAGPTSSSSSRR